MIFQSKAKRASEPTPPVTSAQPASPAETVHRPVKPVRHSVIPVDMQVTGDLVSAGDINVEGTIHGNITCRTLTLDGEPTISGSVKAETIRICGTFNGDVEARKVALTKTAKVIGDIYYQSLEMETGATYEGALHRMTGSGKSA